MVFGAPHFLWLLLLAVPLVALYTRRPRRVTVRVPSLRLWTHVDGVARAPARRLLGWLDQRLVALLLFLLALAGVVAGLARPGAAPTAGRVVVAIVDVSADMAVRTGAPARARLERAREALARLDAAGDVRRWVIAAGAAPRVIAGPGEALPAGAPALEGGRVDLEEALRLAREVLVLASADARAGDDDAREVWLLSAAETPESDVTVRRVDVSGPLAPRTHVSLDGTLTRVDAQHVRLRARLENRGSWSSAALMEVLLDGAPLVRERPLPLGAGEARDLPPRDLVCPRGGVVEVRLLGHDAAGRLDDALAWVVPAPRRLRVTLDDPRASPFLRAALEADAQVDLVQDGDVLVTTRGGGAPRAPGVVWVGPAALASARGLEVVSPAVGPTSPRLEPGASGLDLAGLDLEDRLVAAAARVTPGPGWRVLARAGDDPGAPPLLLTRDDPARREVALTFDLARSDLVVGRALPLLLARATRWAARHDDPQPAWTRAGEVARVPAGSRALAPDGAAARLVSLPGGGLALPLDRGPGVYRLASGAPLVAARPAPHGRDDVAPVGEALSVLAAAPERPHDLALLGVLLALLALVVEGVWFHRRGLP